MGKRSNFERVERDYYPTPKEAVLPLLKHLNANTKFIEPCAGDLALVKILEEYGHECVLASDIEPQAPNVLKQDALILGLNPNPNELIITNPPWDRKLLHPMIVAFSNVAPTWLLFDADWMHTKQSSAFLPRLRKIVSVGRIKWIPGSKMTGKDNCAWYLFDKPSPPNRYVWPAHFFGR